MIVAKMHHRMHQITYYKCFGIINPDPPSIWLWTVAHQNQNNQAWPTERQLLYAAPVVWMNSLPPHIRSPSISHQVRAGLKTNLFKKAYTDNLYGTNNFLQEWTELNQFNLVCCTLWTLAMAWSATEENAFKPPRRLDKDRSFLHNLSNQSINLIF